MTMNKQLKGASALVAILVLAGCSGGVEKDASYGDAAALKDAMVSAGYECPQWSDADTTDAFDAGACLSDKRDQMRTYPSLDEREKDTEGIILGCQLSAVSTRVEKVVLVGANWSVCGPIDAVSKLQPELGGFMPDMGDVRIP